MKGIEAIIGYAIGTAQVLLIDWWRRARSHRQDLLLIRAELRRMQAFGLPFDFAEDDTPRSDMIPSPPEQTELFLKAIGQTEWRLTDEYSDDNSQQALMHVLDGAAALRHYHAKAMAEFEESRRTSGKESYDATMRVVAYTRKYDEVLEEVLFLISDALRDIDRRLGLLNLNDQMGRAFGELPPAPRTTMRLADDPRFVAWKNARRKSAG